MRIPEMESHYVELEQLEAQIKEMEARLNFSTVFDLCQAALPHVEPAFKLRKKRSMTPETPPLRAFTVLWKYGPLLFELQAVEGARDFISSNRYLARHENRYLESAESAVAAIETARLLWNQLETQPGFLQRNINREIGLDREQAVLIVELWEKLGLLDRVPEKGSWRLHLRTLLTEVAAGICMNCGLRVKGRKEILLQPVKCQKCGIQSYFHLPVADPSQK